MDTTHKKDYCTEIHNQIIGWTGNCDTKASIVLAFIGVLVSITFTSEYLLGTIEKQIRNIIIYWRDNCGYFSISSTLMFVSLIGFTLFMSLCCYYAISSLRANVICPDDSIIFFGKIANLSKEEYIDKVRGVTDEEIEYDKLSQIHTCAKICNDKFVFYNQSIKYLCIGLLLFVCFVLFSIILKAS